MMPSITATYDDSEQLVNVDETTLSVAVSDGAPGCMSFLAGAIAAHMGAVITGYCQRHNLNASGLMVELAYSSEGGQITKLAAVLALPNADCTKRRTALEEIAAQCTLGTVPVRISICDRNSMRENALSFKASTALMVDDQSRGLAKT